MVTNTKDSQLHGEEQRQDRIEEDEYPKLVNDIDQHRDDRAELAEYSQEKECLDNS